MDALIAVLVRGIAEVMLTEDEVSARLALWSGALWPDMDTIAVYMNDRDVDSGTRVGHTVSVPRRPAFKVWPDNLTVGELQEWERTHQRTTYEAYTVYKADDQNRIWYLKREKKNGRPA